MDYLAELIALGFDSIICGICLRQYFHCKNAISTVKSAKCFEGGVELTDNHVGSYVAIRGAVKSIGEPLRSINNKDVTGVIQELSVKEHIVARTTAGFWADQECIIQKIYDTVPFVLKQGNSHVEVINPLAADILDLDVVCDRFEPSVPTILDHLWGFFTGVRQRGVQTTERMLREGVVVTGIGELSKSMGKPDSFMLQSPLNGAPFYITSMSINSLLQKLDNHKRVYGWLFVTFGTIGLIISGMVVWRYWNKLEQEQAAEQLRQSIAAHRKARRQRVRETGLKEDEVCVVCRTNPREIILLPCGHVCLCEDCSDDIMDDCPYCRSPIVNKAAAYIV